MSDFKAEENMQYLFFSSKPKFISVVLIVANLDQQKFPCRDDLHRAVWTKSTRLAFPVKVMHDC